jgi:anti-anti-sigma factor
MMEVRFTRQSDVVIVHLQGRLNLENIDPFRSNCFRHLVGEKVIFNLRELHFVGSTGIKPFVATIEELSRRNEGGIRVCEIGPEFQKILHTSNLPEQVFCDKEWQAYNSFVTHPMPDIIGDPNTSR